MKIETKNMNLQAHLEDKGKVHEINLAAVEIAEKVVEQFKDGKLYIDSVRPKACFGLSNGFEIEDYIRIVFRDNPHRFADEMKQITLECYSIKLDGMVTPRSDVMYKVSTYMTEITKDESRDNESYESYSFYIPKTDDDNLEKRAANVLFETRTMACDYLIKMYFNGEIHKKYFDANVQAMYDRILSSSLALKNNL